MPRIKIPEKLIEWFRDEGIGIDKLAEFLELPDRCLPVFIVNPGAVPVESKKSRKVETISATAGNVNADITVPANKKYNFSFGCITLVADANAANRYILLRILDADGNIVYRSLGNTTAITAGQTKRTTYAIDGFHVGGAVIAIDNEHAFLPIGPVVLYPGEIMRIFIGNGLVGDSFSGFLVFEEEDV